MFQMLLSFPQSDNVQITESLLMVIYINQVILAIELHALYQMEEVTPNLALEEIAVTT